MPDILADLRKPLVPVRPEDEDVFRLGLVLNGTVSSGAWTAGVLDALMEALDAWQAAKEDGLDVPRHRVRIDVLTGASGGGVCGAIFARAASRHFQHGAPAEGTQSSNPFWQIWVEALTLGRMLQTIDLEDESAPAASLLDGAAITAAVNQLLGWQGLGAAGPRPPRPWLANPFHLGVTLTNLRGIPYRVPFAPEGEAPRNSWFTDHADHALFAFRTGPGAGAARPDEVMVPENFGDPAWVTLGQFARATAAFPVGFPPVRLSRPTAHYQWRAVMAPGGTVDGQALRATPRLLVPAWAELPDHMKPNHNYVFDAVDGGALNNQPLELGRSGLAGFGNSLERDPRLARAAILLIDPFAAGPDVSPPRGPLDLMGAGGALLTTFKSQARYATSDLLLATDSTVASRFLLTAGRRNAANGKSWGEAALTTSGAGAFLGFAFRAYRVHDYLLGRQNCLGWLRKHFGLPADNRVFGRFPNTGAAAEYVFEDGRMPIIPLVAPLRDIPEQPDWPIIDPATVNILGPLKERLAGVIHRTGLLDEVPCDGKVTAFLSGWAGRKARDAILAAVVKTNAKA